MSAAVDPLSRTLDSIESELARLWPDLPEPSGDDVAGGGAFGHATMAFPQWLRFVFLPAARERIASGDLPGSSQVGAQAVRELDGYPEADTLVGLLSEFDVQVVLRA